ncbi:hypothetical protein V5799_026509 [Amblyomma americanum]|uniref:Uncharacterized protein n=1 Tax=Amblyomma americanum TaxID=6943 RepID=A0AAQ4DID3_AMBAM
MTVYATLQFLTAFYRLSGCCPIRGLVGEHPSRLECARVSRYTAYSAFCVALAAVTVAEAIADSSTRGSLEARLHVFFAIVTSTECLVNWTTAVVGSPLLISFLRQCASLERRRPCRRTPRAAPSGWCW